MTLTIDPAVPSDAAGLAALINDVYEVAEEGLWLPGTPRTSVDEVAALIAAGELRAARLDGEVVGSVRVRPVGAGTGELGMLTASRKHRGAGIGRELIRYAEADARAAGRSTMQLQILMPREWAHPSKEFLRDWYTRLGYRHVHDEPFDDSRLVTGCALTVWHKPL